MPYLVAALVGGGECFSVLYIMHWRGNFCLFLVFIYRVTF